MAATYLRFGQPMSAKPYLDYARKTYKQQNMSEIGSRLLLETTSLDYARAIGNWKRAYQHLATVRELEKSQFVADRDGAVSRLSVEYKTEKNEALLKTQRDELALRADNLRLNQQFLIILLGALVLAGGFSVVFFRLNQKNQRISRQNVALVKEQNHRVKNNLQVVSGLLLLQSYRLTDPVIKQALEETQLRVETMSVLHRRLYDGAASVTVNVETFIPELIEMGLQTFGYGPLQPVYDLTPGEVPAKQALPLGLILTTNACKCAFPGNARSAFRVSYRQTGKQISVEVADNGPGFATPPNADGLIQSSTSFGLLLIQMQVEQLRGSARFSSANGAIFQLTFPV